MLFRLKPEQVEIGMFVHAIEGRWIEHSFWRTQFLVETPELLTRIRQSGVDALVIDDSRSRPAVSRNRSEPRFAPNRGPGAARATRGTTRTAASPHKGPPRPASYAQERRRAARVIDKSRKAVVDMFEMARLGRAVEVKAMVPLAQAVGDSIQRQSRALLNLVRLKEKDEYTYLHSVAVCALMINLARHLELGEAVVQQLGVAGLLHDVGKVAISDDILLKPGMLDAGERRVVESHPLAGHRLLAQSPDISPAALDVCLHHHEKMDGSGYPDRLAGDALSLYARMGAICDVYDAVTSDRPYKNAWTPCEALTVMKSWPGHFDPDLLDRFADSLGLWPAGTLVRMSTGQLGIVTGSAGEHGEAQMVRIFFDCDTLTEIAPFDISVSHASGDPQIRGRDSARFWRFDDWNGLRARVLAADCGGPAPS